MEVCDAYINCGANEARILGAESQFFVGAADFYLAG